MMFFLLLISAGVLVGALPPIDLARTCNDDYCGSLVENGEVSKDEVSLLQTRHCAEEIGISNASTCGLVDGIVKPDCEKSDMGSCGNACCTLEVGLEATPSAVYENVVAFLDSDSAYKHVAPTKELSDNITAYNTEFKYILQAIHTTSGRHYNDTLDFNIRVSDSAPSLLRAFSISGIHGALGDSGQNYKSLAYMLRALGVDPSTTTILYGCGMSTEASFIDVKKEVQVRKLALPEASVSYKRKNGTASGESTCGFSGLVPDCDHQDMGSCGNACCALEVELQDTPGGVYASVVTFLESEDWYTHVAGKMPFGEHAPDNVTTPGDPWKYIFQGIHTTSGDTHYNDTLDFNIRSLDSGPSILRAFSISDIHGALGDSGQNYKTLVYMLRALNVDISTVKMLYGCGMASSSACLGGVQGMVMVVIAAIFWRW